LLRGVRALASDGDLDVRPRDVRAVACSEGLPKGLPFLRRRTRGLLPRSSWVFPVGGYRASSSVAASASARDSTHPIAVQDIASANFQGKTTRKLH
jgi:hypothetical protein